MNVPDVLDIETIVPPCVKTMVKSDILNEYTNIFSRHLQAILVFVPLTQYLQPFFHLIIMYIHVYNPSQYLIGGKDIQSQDMLKISENMLVYLHI